MWVPNISSNDSKPFSDLPSGNDSMYGIFIWVIDEANVGKYYIHGAHGSGND